jgi:formylglycine-generating enzyme required for sulfatase activity
LYSADPEWCEDTWHDRYDGAPTGGSAWTLGGTEGGRVARGGSWYYYPTYLRAACRYGVTGVFNFIGFRLARMLKS